MNDIKQLYDDIRAYKKSRILATAIHLGVLSSLKRHGKLSIHELSSDLLIDHEWLATILNFLNCYGLVKIDEGLYSLTELGLTAEIDTVLASFSGYHFHCFKSWIDLPNAMRSGKGKNFHRMNIGSSDFCDSYLSSMSELARFNSEFVLKEAGQLFKGQILDIGAGPAYLCRYLAQNDDNVTVTALDFDEIVQSAEKLYETPDNFKWVREDFLQWKGQQRFNTVYCGHVLEYCSEEHLPVWLRKIHFIIREGGSFVSVMFLRNGKGSDEELNLFEISTGLNGPSLGRILPPAEIHEILVDSGFTEISIKEIPPGPSYSEYLITCNVN